MKAEYGELECNRPEERDAARELAENVSKRDHEIIEILASEYSSVYYIDLKTGALTPYTMNAETETTFGSVFRSGITYSEAYKLYVEKLVHPDDQIMMLKAGSIRNITRQLSGQKTFITIFRSRDDRYSEMKFVKVGGESDVPTAVALGFTDRDEVIKKEILRKKNKERDQAVISGLTDDFGCVLYTSYDTGDEIHYRYDTLLEANIEGWSDIATFGERLDRLINTIMLPEDRQAFWAATRCDVVKAAVDKEGFYYVNFRILIDGEVVYYQAKFARDDLHPETNVIVGFHNVDAETKRELQTLEKAKLASKAKTDFLFNMSHDIRTPLNAIIGFTDMAMKHIDDREKVMDSLAKTQLASNLLLSLINDILDMSRIESGKITLSEDKGDVYLSFTSIQATMEELAKGKNIDLSFTIENVQDRYIYCDFSHCLRVFVNVITNAIKYTNNGGWVRVKGEQIGRRDNYGIYRYTVEDNGIGMSEEFQKRAFDEFTRENTVTVSGIQGTGLGLSVCRSFVNAMNGTIECKSKQGVGTTFTITLPLKIQDGVEWTHPVTQETFGAGQESGTISLAGRRVLLVEDNELNREIAQSILEEEGMVVETACDGIEAVDALRDKGPDYYDVVLMDIQMPVMNGHEASLAIRKMYPDAALPIIALSANAFAEDKAASLRAGMDAHVAKPINVAELKSVLTYFIK